jgi:hypothetical protein
MMVSLSLSISWYNKNNKTGDKLPSFYIKLKTMGLKGELHPNAKLAGDDVIQIRHLAALGFSLKIISKNYKISLWNVKSIVNNKTWKHI